MVRSLLVFFFFISTSVKADLFDFDSKNNGRESKIPALIGNLKKIEIKDDPAFEELFNQSIKAIENGIEDEKLYCSGETTDSSGKSLPPAQKQLCMRELKKNYVEATNTIFDLKKKYLGFIHQRQIQKLSEIQQKLKAEIEKNF